MAISKRHPLQKQYDESVSSEKADHLSQEVERLNSIIEDQQTQLKGLPNWDRVRDLERENGDMIETMGKLREEITQLKEGQPTQEAGPDERIGAFKEILDLGINDLKSLCKEKEIKLKTNENKAGILRILYLDLFGLED